MGTCFGFAFSIDVMIDPSKSAMTFLSVGTHWLSPAYQGLKVGSELGAPITISLYEMGLDVEEAACSSELSRREGILF